MSVTQASGDSSEMATITCGCGEVKLSLPNTVPKFRCGCCCAECLQRVYIECSNEQRLVEGGFDSGPYSLRARIRNRRRKRRIIAHSG